MQGMGLVGCRDVFVTLQILIAPPSAARVLRGTTIIRFAQQVCNPSFFQYSFDLFSFLLYLFYVVACVDVTCGGHGVCGASGCVCDSPNFDIATECSTCAAGYYNYPSCTSMQTIIFSMPFCLFIFLVSVFILCVACVDATCAGHGTCGVSGCVCTSPNFDNSTECSTCAVGYYNYPL